MLVAITAVPFSNPRSAACYNESSPHGCLSKVDRVVKTL